MPKINDLLQGFQNGLPAMKDYRHASRLYIDDLYKLMPKQKFMFHVVFDTDETMFIDGFESNEKYQMDMLVKTCELPKYGLNLEEKVQYNKKQYTATRIQYEPVSIAFHDDHADTINAFWKKYYEYYIADSLSIPIENNGRAVRDSYYDTKKVGPYRKYGLDTPVQRQKPYLRGIEIFVLHKQRFTSMSLVNPIIGSFAHDNLDQADGTGVLSNTMQVFYESVIYRAGTITRPKKKGFANINYDKEPSPLTILGGGTNSIFGPGGIVDGVGSVIKNVQTGNILGAILSASNTYNNAKKMKKKDVKEELKGIAKKGVLEIGKQGGSITNPVAQFAIGAAIAKGIKETTGRGMTDNNKKANSTVIIGSNLDTTNFLTADESYKLVTNDSSVKDEIAAGLYFKDIGSRKGSTVAQSNIEYSNATDNVKTVYRSKATTDIRKLVTEGYLKINRTTQNVSIATEKAGL
jgi:hypothetical protein